MNIKSWLLLEFSNDVVIYVVFLQEIAWQRLDELQPTSDEISVISRSITGLKLYMVAPFLASLKSWISSHQPPVAPRPDMPLKAMCVWKARNNSIGSGTVIMESHLNKPVSDAHPSDLGPGKSFRNFRFDTAAILRAMESGFPA
ncbi:M7GPPPN-MRNA HYDROLASE [Salix purpurea]|uniref:M7GPPPN-MRNA HYDROLASE n=1 Tax=Salix purpurea TaxID=77065 RepID=A0A9Q0UC20_SALPP|nr:M7GPPPN-MRNA HYDROLASE [Salix purpurea]